VECLAIVGYHADPMGAVGLWRIEREMRVSERIGIPR